MSAGASSNYRWLLAAGLACAAAPPVLCADRGAAAPPLAGEPARNVSGAPTAAFAAPLPSAGSPAKGLSTPSLVQAGADLRPSGSAQPLAESSSGLEALGSLSAFVQDAGRALEKEPGAGALGSAVSAAFFDHARLTAALAPAGETAGGGQGAPPTPRLSPGAEPAEPGGAPAPPKPPSREKLDVETLAWLLGSVAAAAAFGHLALLPVSTFLAAHLNPLLEALWRLGLHLPQIAAPGATQALAQYWSTYVIELTMSFDNVAAIVGVLAWVPRRYERSALNWGLAGTILLRLGMTGLGVGLITAHPWLFFLGGALLLDVAVDQYFGASLTSLPRGRLEALLRGKKAASSPRGAWAAAVVVISAIGVLFAVDSVTAALAVSKSWPVIFSANVFAILALRPLIWSVKRLEEIFVHLKKGVAVAIAFAAYQMIAGHIATVFGAGRSDLALGPLASTTVILSIIGLSVLMSVVERLRRPRS